MTTHPLRFVACLGGITLAAATATATLTGAATIVSQATGLGTLPALALTAITEAALLGAATLAALREA
ncbi:hypothetical protein [Nocardiopsis sp. NPDC006938]|uniref:hypothetical protein n=1 Tax=Nocardiopsis sp. NPDC006938 TaxID=3364337 RepID=UPI003693613D